MYNDSNVPLLRVKNLQTVFYGDGGTVKAVDGISFQLNKGETLGIVGESGSGKSVTSLSIMRLIPDPPGKIIGGEISYFGENQKEINLLQIPESEMRSYRGNRIAMIFQEPMTSLNPVYTCGNQVVEAIMLHQKMSAAEATLLTKDLFAKVKLPDPTRVFQSYPHQLSGGQKQRVMIAMALSCRPDILIADEPTTALDVTVQKTILELLQEMKDETGASVIFITHDLGVIAEIADKVLVMYKGKIVEQGGVQQIFTNPQHPYTKGLLACRPPLQYRLRRLPVISDFMDAQSKAIEAYTSVDKVLHTLRISPEETAERLEKLLHQKPILKVENLKVTFPIQRNLLGMPSKYLTAVDGVS
ncbi:MAG TPA: ATP-binding cassette domain-containing protein, partial [Phaeodactylibacter sp.]|nr:ATP-binding cassette domain-containing protein [Phaeodactylibacter sp.]